MVIDYLAMDLFFRWQQKLLLKKWWWFLTVMIHFLGEKLIINFLYKFNYKKTIFFLPLALYQNVLFAEISTKEKYFIGQLYVE